MKYNAIAISLLITAMSAVSGAKVHDLGVTTGQTGVLSGLQRPLYRLDFRTLQGSNLNRMIVTPIGKVTSEVRNGIPVQTASVQVLDSDIPGADKKAALIDLGSRQGFPVPMESGKKYFVLVSKSARDQIVFESSAKNRLDFQAVIPSKPGEAGIEFVAETSAASLSTAAPKGLELQNDVLATLVVGGAQALTLGQILGGSELPGLPWTGPVNAKLTGFGLHLAELSKNSQDPMVRYSVNRLLAERNVQGYGEATAQALIDLASASKGSLPIVVPFGDQSWSLNNGIARFVAPASVLATGFHHNHAELVRQAVYSQSPEARAWLLSQVHAGDLGLTEVQKLQSDLNQEIAKPGLLEPVSLLGPKGSLAVQIALALERVASEKQQPIRLSRGETGSSQAMALSTLCKKWAGAQILKP